ncbi:174_t:CDS:2 [Rhizophagus irregularis]|nr:174_t:CDS:2 [Rhizophagus irregularis]
MPANYSLLFLHHLPITPITPITPSPIPSKIRNCECPLYYFTNSINLFM